MKTRNAWLAMGLMAAGCGNALDPQSKTHLLAASPTAGEWKLQSFTPTGATPSNNYWWIDITLLNNTNGLSGGTFSGTLGCESCSGQQLSNLSGAWDVVTENSLEDGGYTATGVQVIFLEWNNGSNNVGFTYVSNSDGSMTLGDWDDGSTTTGTFTVTSAPASTPTPPALGPWGLASFTGSGGAPQDTYWIVAITLNGAGQGATSGTYAGTWGCGLSNCSGDLPNVSGSWSVDTGANGPEITFNGNAVSGAEAFSYTLNSDGSWTLTPENDPDVASPGSFTLAPVAPPPQPPALGPWTLNGTTTPNSTFWIDQITLSGSGTGATSGTFTATWGCISASVCSSTSVSGVTGTWSVGNTSGGPAIVFELTSIIGAPVQFLYVLNSDGSMTLTLSPDPTGDMSTSAPFTLVPS